MSISDTTAIILAGGKGTRLQSVVSDRPKPLALVCGRPFIEYVLDQLDSFGIKRVIVSTGHLGEQIKTLLGSTYKTLSLHYSQEHVPLGTAGALHHALPFITSQQVLVLNGDSYCDIDFNEFFKRHMLKNALVTIAAVSVPDVSRYGSITSTGEGLIEYFREKGIQVAGGLINAGVYVIERSVLLAITPDRMISLERDIFPQYLHQSIYSYETTGMFIDIGVPADYRRAQLLFQDVKKT
ncbi:MAG: nucleotidyltransferase family protein [Desulfuromonadaceae bacterium]|nr:nucleotidyltransferase family protein [Desulfuromonadaceae bacterium]